MIQINKQQLQEAIDEEIHVYSDPENEFQNGYLHAMKKYKAVIALHTFDDTTAQEEIKSLREANEALHERASHYAAVRDNAVDHATQAERERDALLEGLDEIICRADHIPSIANYARALKSQNAIPPKEDQANE